MKQEHTKYTQINTNKSTHSEMGPVWQNPIQRTVRTARQSVLMTVHSSVHNTTQNSSDNLPSYLQTNITCDYAYRVTCISCCMASPTATVTVSFTAISNLKTFSSTSMEASSWPTSDWPERSAFQTALSPTRFASLQFLLLVVWVQWGEIQF